MYVFVMLLSFDELTNIALEKKKILLYYRHVTEEPIRIGRKMFTCLPAHH